MHKLCVDSQGSQSQVQNNRLKIPSVEQCNHNAGAIARIGAYFGEGTIAILLDNVGCTGTESRLTSCSYSSHTLDCSHRDDAGVTCQSTTSGGDYYEYYYMHHKLFLVRTLAIGFWHKILRLPKFKFQLMYGHLV